MNEADDAPAFGRRRVHAGGEAAFSPTTRAAMEANGKGGKDGRESGALVQEMDDREAVDIPFKLIISRILDGVGVY